MALKVASPSWIGGGGEESKQVFTHFCHPSRWITIILSIPQASLPQKVPGQMPLVYFLVSLRPRENCNKRRLIMI